MKPGNLTQPNTEIEVLDATRRTSPHILIQSSLHLTRRSYILARLLLPSAHSHLILAFATSAIPAPRIFPHLSTTTHSFGQPSYLNKRSISRCDVSRSRSWTCRLASCLCASASPLQVDTKSTHQMDHHTPVVGTVISVVVSLVSITIISSFLSGSLSFRPRWLTHPLPPDLSPATPPNGIS